jgi:hypothetical protein
VLVAYGIMSVSQENWPLPELLMGVETPIPPKMINAAAPGRKPPRRIKTVEIMIFADFHGSGVNRIGSCLFLQNGNFEDIFIL